MLDCAHAPLRVEMEDLVHNPPLPVDLKQREQVSEPMAGPVFELQPHGGSRSHNIDAGDVCLKPRGWTILVIPVRVRRPSQTAASADVPR